MAPSRLPLVLSLAALALATAAPRPSEAQDPSLLMADPSVRQYVTELLNDPARTEALIAQAARPDRPMRPPMILLAADALARRGRWRQATRLAERVRAAEPGGEWGRLAAAALGWMALARGDLIEARVQYAAAPEGPLRRFVEALCDGAEGNAGAAEAFRALSDAPDASPDLQALARLGRGYAYYWSGDYAAAADAFAALRVGRFADDARYATARAEWASGDLETARKGLARLADGGGDASSSRIPRSLLDLRPRALLRHGFQRYRTLPPGSQETLIVGMLDGDGSALARAALRRFDRLPEAIEARNGDPARVAVRPAASTAAGQTALGSEAPQSPPAPDHRTPWRALGMLAAALVAALVLRWRSGRGPAVGGA